MKLLTKTTIFFLTAMVTLLGVTGFYLFAQFNGAIEDRSDKELLAGELEWINYLETQSANGNTVALRSKELAIYPVNSAPERFAKIGDAGDYTIESGEKIPYRQLTQVVSVDGVSYQLIIKKSQEQKVALVKYFTRIIVFVFLGLFIATLLFNWVISRKLWRPFQSSLVKIRSADLQKMQSLRFEATGTSEFNELNASLNAMSNKIYSDFLSMKEFTEDAAHEMQTPIAVVQSKLEILLQDNNLNQAQIDAVIQSSEALNRLAKLNQGLLFLAKIQNNQYAGENAIDFGEVTGKYLILFNELMQEKKLTVETDMGEAFKLVMHPLLADSMISNLLANAIKYNFTGGKIKLTTTATTYEVCNTSHFAPIPAEKLFKRFSGAGKGDQSSNGLGLAIVKKIADTNNLVLRYQMKAGTHQFTIEKI